MANRLPIVVLAGSDLRAGAVPPGMSADDMLTGFKGALPLPRGRCLVGELIERLRATGQFQEPLLVGPQRIYEGQVDTEIIDVEGDLADTLRCTFVELARRYDPSDPVALIPCDILPEADEITELLRSCYQPHRECLFWCQLIAARPEQMGASSWKPAYPFRTTSGQPPQNMYPGHLVIVRPSALRLDLAIRLLRVAYRYRNRELHQRRLRVVAHGIWDLMRQDLHNLLSLQLPLLTLAIPYYGLRALSRCRRQQLTVAEFERAVAKGFLHRRFHRSAGGRPVVFSVTPLVSFAQDIDTKAELDFVSKRVQNEKH